MNEAVRARVFVLDAPGGLPRELPLAQAGNPTVAHGLHRSGARVGHLVEEFEE